MKISPEKLIPCGVACDPEPGNYYVSIYDRENSRLGLLLGPFREHQKALDLVDSATAKASDLNPWSWFHAFGTVKMADGFKEPGVLNEFFKQELHS